MTRKEIKKIMLKHMQTKLEETLKNQIDFIDEYDIEDFLMTKNFGQDIIDTFISFHERSLKQSILEEIFNEFQESDLETPF